MRTRPCKNVVPKSDSIMRIMNEAREIIEQMPFTALVPRNDVFALNWVTLTGDLARAFANNDREAIVRTLAQMTPYDNGDRVSALSPSCDEVVMRLPDAIVEITERAGRLARIATEGFDDWVAARADDWIDDPVYETRNAERARETHRLENEIHTLAAGQLWSLTDFGEKHLTEIN